jgi:hypothetical protein
MVDWKVAWLESRKEFCLVEKMVGRLVDMKGILSAEDLVG